MNHDTEWLMTPDAGPDPLELIRALFDRPGWMRDAACAEHDPAAWFSTGQAAGSAIDVCNACLVRTECLDYAMNDPTLRGVWGGMSEPERRRLRSEAA